MAASTASDTQRRNINEAARKRLTEKCLREFEQHMQLLQDDLNMLYLLGHDVENSINETDSMSVNIISICRTGKSLV